MICESCAAALPPGAHFCPSCGAADRSAARNAVAEERKLVTVVFCDLVGSTELSEALDPETLRSVVLRYFAAMRAPIERYGGRVEKFIGDAVMAVFGVPAMHEDDAARAAAAALEMLAALATLNADLGPALGVRLRVRMGINTGAAVTSADASAQQVLVSGETVNIAARLEQNAGHGEILVGPATRRALGPAARCESVGELRLKGKAEPVSAHRLLGMTGDALDSARRFDVPLVGRRAELAALDRAFGDSAADRYPVVAAVLGEPGIGKTRLVRTWLAGLDRPGAASSSPVAVGTGRCRPFGDHASLAPLAEALRQVLAETPAPDDEVLSVLESGLLGDGTPGASLEGTCLAVARVLAGAGPVVLALDDCQWASETLFDAVGRVAAAAAGTPVLILVLGRLDLLDQQPRRIAGWRPLVLAGLSEADCRTVAAELADATVEPDRLARMIDACGGNPFHLEQLLGGWRQHSEMPQSLQALLGARIDALAPAERAALDLASVLGKEFSAGELATLAANSPEGDRGGPLRAAAGPALLDPLAAALTRLTRLRFVEPGHPAAGDASFRFGNGLIREASYLAMAKRTRADRHERVAEIVTGKATAAFHIERAYRYRIELGVRDERTGLLRTRASRLLAESGGQALKRSDLVWAETLLERAVDLSEPGDPCRITAMRQLGEVHVARGRTEEGRALFRAVSEAAASPLSGPDHVEGAHARLALAVTDPSSPVGAAAKTAREMLPVFEAADDALGLARVHVRMAQHEQFLGRHEPALVLLNKALGHATRGGAEPELAVTLGALGISLWRGPTAVPAAITHCRALLAEHGGPRPAVAVTVRCPLAVLLALDDQADAARDVLEAVGRAVRTLGYAEAAVVLPVFEAAIQTLADRRDLALVLLDQAVEAALGLGAAAVAGGVVRESARLLLDLGRGDEAAARLSDPGAREGLLASDAADLDGLLARLAALRGDGDEAGYLADRAMAAARAMDSPLVKAVACLDRAAVFELAGDRDRALGCVDAALGIYAAKGHRPGVRAARRQRDRLAARAVGRTATREH